MITEFKNATVITCDSEFNIYEKCSVVTKNNKILFVGQNYNEKADNVVNCADLVLMPGFININYNSQQINGVITNVGSAENNANVNVLLNIDNISLNVLKQKVALFLNKNIKPILYLQNYLNNANNYEQIIQTAKAHNLKMLVQAGSTLDEMGFMDNNYSQTPIEFIESYGLLDHGAIVSSCANLNKEDFEILSRYNTSVILTLTEDLISGNGIPSVLTIKKYGLNMCLSSPTNDMFKEMFLAYSLPRGILNTTNALTHSEVISMATTNVAKALNLENLGQIKEGFIANFIALNIKYLSKEQLLKNIVECCNVSNIKFFVNNGEIVNKIF